MNLPSADIAKPTRVRYGVLAFACALSTITYLDRVCFGTVASNVQSEFGLSESEKGWLFTAFAFAYAIFEVPSGWLGDRFGARSTLIRIVLWWSIFTALTGSIYPTSGTMVAFYLLLSVRFLFGMGEAGAYPNIARAFHNWFPFTERGSVKGTVWMAGRFAGGMTAFIVYALMFDTVLSDGTRVTHWRHIFYLFGILGIIWCVAWWWWYRDNPAEKAGVNQAEINLIRQGEDHSHRKLVVPWVKLLSSTNLWCLCIMYFCSSYGWYLFITYWPGYLSDHLKIKRGEEKWTQEWWIAGLMAGLPLLIGAIGCLLGGLATDAYIKRTGDRKWGRRLFGVIGHGMSAVCFFAALFFMDSPWAFALLVTFASFWNDTTMGSSWASCLDIGKRYSGIVAGCMNTVGNLGGAVAGIATGEILEYFTGSLQRGSPGYAEASHQGWQVNIFLFGSAYVVAVFCWLKFDPTKIIAPEENR